MDARATHDSSSRAGVTVDELTAALGSGYVDLIDHGTRAGAPIAGVCVYEPDAAWVGEHQLALLTDAGEEMHAASVALRHAASRGCVGVVVDRRVGPLALAALARLARDERVALYERCSGVSWLALADAIRDVLHKHDGGGEDMVGSVAPGDLTGLAEALADFLGGPVIIEDANFQVLAFSTLTDAVDHGRDAAILGGRIPDEWLRHLEEKGALETLLTTDHVVNVDDGPYQAQRRLLRGIRVDDHPVGVLWVAEGSKPLRDDVAEKMHVAAGICAPHLLRYQDEMLGQRAAQRKILRTLIETGELSRSVAEDLGVVPADAYCMLALRRADGAASSHAERNRLVESVDLYCQAYRWRVATTAVGQTIYCLVALTDGRELGNVQELGEGLADNARRTLRFDTLVAVSEQRQRLTSAPELRDQADNVLEVLARTGQPVLRFDDAVPQILLNRLGAAVRTDEHARYHKLEALREHDRTHGTNYVHTLAVFLRAFGNTRAAAVELDLHPTTLRYRLGRITELSGIDFTNSDERLFCELVLRDG
ncbi:MAG: hypothetical protein GEV07_23800 [Streptosporangiales bacterium]|nr:hypothetical protein [Streptosporangiales bacterium]